MRPKITLRTFRMVAKLEETMARGMMPRVSAADPRALAPLHWAPNTVRTARTLTVAPLTYRMAVARA